MAASFFPSLSAYRKFAALWIFHIKKTTKTHFHKVVIENVSI